MGTEGGRMRKRRIRRDRDRITDKERANRKIGQKRQYTYALGRKEKGRWTHKREKPNRVKATD